MIDRRRTRISSSSADPREGLVAAAAAALAAAGVQRGAVVLAAVSGGPDSTALLSALAELRSGGGLTLHACTVDHGIRTRGESRGDVDFLRALCASLRVPLLVAKVPPGELRRLSRREGRSLEEVAREARMRELSRAATRVGADVVALGHTRDDWLETVLMGILRGSDARGLRGIAARRGIFVRPLLACTRAEVLSHLASRGLGFRVDSTNADRSLLRNRVRAELVPVLEKSFPGWRTGITMLARKNALAAEVIDARASSLRWKRSGEGFSLPAVGFFALPAAVRATSLLTLFDSFRCPGSPRRLPYRFMLPALAAEPAVPGGVVLRGHGALLRVTAGRVHWGPDIVTSGKRSYLIEANRTGRFEIRAAGVVVEVSPLPVAALPGTRGSRPDAVILEREIVPPLVLRSKRTGDRLLLEQGTKTLKALFAEWKVPEGDRWKVPILVDRRGVLAVLGGAAGCGTAVRRSGEAGARGEGSVAVRAMKKAPAARRTGDARRGRADNGRGGVAARPGGGVAARPGGGRPLHGRDE